MKSTKLTRGTSVCSILAAAFAIACSGGVEDEGGHAGEGTGEVTPALDESAGERMNGSGPVGEVTLTNVLGEPRHYKYELVDGVAIAEGDIVLGTLEEIEQQQKGVVRTDRVWPLRTLVYRFHADLTTTQKSRINSAMSHWTAQTGVSFRTQANNEGAYVEFVPGTDGCSSSVGRTGSRQELKVGNCSSGSIIHEIGHAFGFEHEHTRADRDNTLDYFEDRVVEGKEHNFTLSNQTFHRDISTLDLGSIMMYGSYAFAAGSDGAACSEGEADCFPTLTRNDGTTWNSQRAGLSATDIRTFRTLYNRFDTPKVSASRILSGATNRNRFCQDKGYTTGTTSTLESISGSTPHAYVSNGSWVHVADPGNTISVYKTIFCTF